MLNRVIYSGKVYYKIIDLGLLFDLSQYKLKKILKEQNIETTKLKGFGRSIFVLEENVSVIEVNGEITIVKTTIVDAPLEKKAVKNAEKAPANQTQVKKSEKKSEKNKDVVAKPASNTNEKEELTDIEKLQSEHELLIKNSKVYYVRLHKVQKEYIADEIIERHLGHGNKLLYTTLDDIEAIRLIVPELKTASETELQALTS
ncbi:hypothetical protein [Peribacillus sp. FSL E2-0159]|uniref:hypothetical protein n=1 Tax=Peribacillus sp. FSL E2-0159 TaxID=2975289 RepID=UPI00315B2AB5